MIQIIVQAQKASCRRSPGERITTGMVGKKITFDFPADWDGLVKTAVFEGSGTAKDVVLNGASAEIPHECLTAPGGMLSVGVFGTDGTMQTPTIYTDIGQIERGADPSGEESADQTLPIWAQLQAMMGDLGNLTTTAKENLVAAINEAAKSGGGGAGTAADVKMQVVGGYIQYSTDGGESWNNLISMEELIGPAGPEGPQGPKGPQGETGAAGKDATVDDTLTQAGKAADAAVVGQKFSELSEEIANLSAGGISATARELLITVLRNGVYSSDQSANITALETALGGSGGGDTPVEPDEPVVATYTITAELVNVTSDNSSASVNEGDSYTATLTAADGYTLDSVTITMGGVDVTADVYADGVISIPAVTGNVVITASASASESGGGDDSGSTGVELPTDGLLDFFDMRNKTFGTVANGGYGVNGSNGGYLFSWSSSLKGYETDDYGFLKSNSLSYAGGTLGQNVTVCTLSYRANNVINQFGWMTHGAARNMGAFALYPQYVDTDGNTQRASEIEINGASVGYNVLIISISQDEMKVYMNGVLQYTVAVAGIENFSRWVSTVMLQSGYAQSSGVAAAIYNKTLSQVEVVEVGEYFKTLEVGA